MRPSGNTGRTTTDPGCVTISLVASTPPGSTTRSRRTPNTRPLNITLLLRTFANDFFLATQSPLVKSRPRHSTATQFLRLATSRFVAALVPVAYTGQRTMPINTVIVDDERPARDELIYLLKGFPEINVIGQGKNGLEAVALIKEHDPDLVFLDVQMPGLDGFGVIKKLVERKLRIPQIVFATAYDNYAIQAFEVNAVDYVLKPFDKARPAKAIQRAKKMIEAQTSPVERLEILMGQLALPQPVAPKSAQAAKLLVKSQQRMFLVDAADLIYASIQDGTITIFTKDFEGVSNYRTIEELASAVDSDKFWRAHRSYLVNINHIKEVVPWFKSSYMLKMNDKRSSEIPVSRAQTKRLRELLKL